MRSAVWNLAVFARRQERAQRWRTLGLGRFDVELRIKSPVAGPQELQRALQARLAPATAAELAACRPGAKAELRQVHLDLRFQQPEHLHLSGLAPLVVERLDQPGGASSGGTEIAYSPLRPADFFVVDERLDLSRQANRFFAAAWRGLAGDGEELLARPHDRLLVVPVRISWPALFDEAAPREERLGLGRREPERVLELLATDVSGELAAADPRLERLPPRLPWLEQRLLAALAGDKPPSFAFVGPAGCGKSNLIHDLAGRLLVRQGFLEHGRTDGPFQVFRLSGRRLISGMSYAGDWEQRCLDLLAECRRRRYAGHPHATGRAATAERPRGEPPPVVLWVDDLAAWGEIGQNRSNRRCLADLFLTPLRRGEILIFGETTDEGFALLEDEAPAFAALFRRVDLERPGQGQALSILLEKSRRLEDEGAAPLRPAALRTLIEKAPLLYGEDAHPGFSCRLLDQAAEEVPEPGPRPAISAARMLELMSRESGLPRDLLRPERPLEIEELKAHFGRRVLGQEEAVQAVCELLVTLKAGLDDPRRPHAVLLFTGPTGTGKTELAKALAGWLYGDERRLLRFDMGEHGDSRAVGRLIGERGRPQGLLTEAVRAQPFSVLLFDEVDKADPDVLNLLLQVFEDGRLTDALGQLADFRQSVLIMTSNLGAHPNPKVGLRLDAEALLLEARLAVERFFAPELWNRIDRVVAFRLLDVSVGRRIAEIELYRIFARRGLVERGVFVRADARVMDRIHRLAFDGRGGARGVKRFLEREVVVALSRALTEADPAAFMLFNLSAPPGGGFRVEVESIKEAEPLPADAAIDRLYELPPSRLLAELPQWLERLAALEREHGEALARERSEQLSAWQALQGAPAAAGSPAPADALHAIDDLRQRLDALRQRLAQEAERREPDAAELREEALTVRLSRAGSDFSFSDKKRTRHHEKRRLDAAARPLAGEEMVALASEILWLEFAARRGGEERASRALIELSLLSEHRPHTRHRGAEAPSLQQELAELLLAGAVGLEGFVTEEPAATGGSAAELAAALARRPQRVWLAAAGNLLEERLRGDVGCYVRVRGDGNQEIVRLVVHPLRDSEAPPAELVARRAELSEGPALPAQGLTLLQLIHFEPAPPESPPSLCRVEDFGLSLEVARPARRLLEVLQPLRRRRQLALLAAARPGGGK